MSIFCLSLGFNEFLKGLEVYQVYLKSLDVAKTISVNNWCYKIEK